MTRQDQMDISIVWQVFEGMRRNYLSECVAILRTAVAMNRTPDQIKEAIYGKA